MNVKNIVFSLVLASFFLILSYDRLYQWDEPFYIYNAAFVPASDYGTFLTAKYGHLFLLKTFIGLTGTGLDAIFYLNLIYASMVLCFVFVSFMVLRDIMGNEDNALYATIVLMFLPLTLFISFKTLSEVPALLFVSLSMLSYVSGLKEVHRVRSIFLLLLSGILLFFGTLCRLDASVMFFSFFVAMVTIRNDKFGIRKMFSSFVVVCMVFSTLILSEIVLLNINPFYLAFEVNEVWHSPFYANLLRLGYVGGIFSLFIALSMFNYKETDFKFALIWFMAANIPILILIDYINIRHYYCCIVPFSILVLMGSKELFKIAKRSGLDEKPIKTGFACLFVLMVVGNMFFMEAFVENELDERAYTHLFEDIDALYSDRIILIPYAFVDYSFLKFAFPDEEIFNVQSIEDTEEEYSGDYLGDTVSLEQFNDTTILYISWRSRREHLLFKDEECGTYNYSWITRDPRIELTKVLEEGDIRRIRYEVYSVRIT